MYLMVDETQPFMISFPLSRPMRLIMGAYTLLVVILLS